MAPDDTGQDIVRWATSYPFERPPGSYLFRDGAAAALDDAAAAVSGRVPVLASGSNASPLQLARKYAAHPAPTRIPVTRATVRSFDSVYSAHITAYGSVAATLFPSLGTELETFITWLDEAELALMHTTEQPGEHYHFAELRGLDVAVEDVGPLDAAFAYISIPGGISREGAPVGLAEVPARNRRFAALGQAEIQELVRGLTAPGEDLEAFIRGNIGDAALRRARAQAIARTALPFVHDGTTVIPV